MVHTSACDELSRAAQQRAFPQDAQKACPARPQRVKIRGVPLGYVEGLNDARTPLADFFSILLEEGSGRKRDIRPSGVRVGGGRVRDRTDHG